MMKERQPLSWRPKPLPFSDLRIDDFVELVFSDVPDECHNLSECVEKLESFDEKSEFLNSISEKGIPLIVDVLSRQNEMTRDQLVSVYKCSTILIQGNMRFKTLALQYFPVDRALQTLRANEPVFKKTSNPFRAKSQEVEAERMKQMIEIVLNFLRTLTTTPAGAQSAARNQDLIDFISGILHNTGGWVTSSILYVTVRLLMNLTAVSEGKEAAFSHYILDKLIDFWISGKYGKSDKMYSSLLACIGNVCLLPDAAHLVLKSGFALTGLTGLVNLQGEDDTLQSAAVFALCRLVDCPSFDRKSESPEVVEALAKLNMVSDSIEHPGMADARQTLKNLRSLDQDK